MLLFLFGMVAGGLIMMVIMATLFVSAREEERSDRLFQTLTAYHEKKIG